MGQAVACRVSRPLASLLLAATLLLASACGGTSHTPTGTPVAPTNGSLTIRASEWKFEPANVVLSKGAPVTIQFQNGGSTLHDMRIDGLHASDVTSKSNGGLSAGHGELFVGSDKGKSGTLTFTPAETGTFTFYCTLPRHRQLGMKGTITVE